MLYIILAALLWGSSFPVITYALGDSSPLLLVVLRFSLAFIILLPRYRVPGRWRLLFRRDIILISIPNALSFIFQFKAQELTTASKTALFVNSSPVFVAVLAWIILKDRFTVRQWAALIIALVGVVITSTRLDFSDFAKVNVGDLLCIGVGFFWAVFIILSKRILQNVSAYDVAQGLYFWTILMTLPFLPFEEIRFAASSIIPVIYLATFTTVAAYYFFLKGSRTSSALAASIIILIEVVVAFGISHFWLDEAFSKIETVGVLLLMAGVLMVVKGEKPLPRPVSRVS